MASIRFSILPSGSKTASAAGGPIAVKNLKEIMVVRNVTAQAGTTPTLDVWLQTSWDGGSSWVDMPHKITLEDNAASEVEGNHRHPAVTTGVAQAQPGARNIGDQVTTTVPKIAIALYEIFGEFIRAAWDISGTTPDYTFEVIGIGKT